LDYNIFKEKAIENIESAELCFNNNKYNASVNRAYYSMLQIAISLLIKEKKIKLGDRIDHTRCIGTFVKTYCNDSKNFPQLKDYLRIVQSVRNIADYETQHINKKQAKRAIEKAKVFVNTVISFKY
jgi:uncharacterized protein (UPF0332 family)